MTGSEAKARLALHDEEGSMSETSEVTVTLPSDIARRMREKVAAGDYETESDIVREGLEMLLADNPALETWLRTEGAAAYDAHVADPSRALSIDEVRRNLAALRGRTTAST
jgi:Arc/MetJ-type ribon-helix-helix transcriptional regulator